MYATLESQFRENKLSLTEFYENRIYDVRWRMKRLAPSGECAHSGPSNHGTSSC